MEFIEAFESHDYPIFASIYHPEYQLVEFRGVAKKNKKALTENEEIAFRLSLLLNRYARRNPNRVEQKHE